MLGENFCCLLQANTNTVFSIFQELPVQEESFPMSTENTSTNINKTKISLISQNRDEIENLELPENKSMERECENLQEIEHFDLQENNSMERECENLQEIEITDVQENNSLEKECANLQAGLALNGLKTILEYQQRLHRAEILFLRSERSKNVMMLQLRKIKIKLKRLQQEVSTMKHVKAINKILNKDQIKLLYNEYKKCHVGVTTH